MKDTLKPGISYVHTYLIPSNKTVPNLYPESEEFQAMPEVFATGFLVGFLEWSCIRAINPHIDWPEEQTASLMPRVGGTKEHPVEWRDGSFDPTWSFIGLVGLGEDVSRIKNNPCRRCDNRKDCQRRIW